MKRTLFFLLTSCAVLLTPSCSLEDNAEKRFEYAKIVELMSCQDLLNELYIASDADVEAMARILNVSPSSIKRLRAGESFPTEQFEERVREIVLYHIQNGRSFKDLRSMLDPEYSSIEWFTGLFSSIDPVQDDYVNTINPTIEYIR